MKLAITALISAAAVAAGAAPQTAGAQPSAPPPSHAPRGNCFRARDVQNHTFANDHTLYINVLPRNVFEVTTSGACLAGAVSSDPIIMKVTPPGTDLVCKAIDLDLAVSPGGIGHGAIPTPCIVKSIRRLSPAEAAALPPKLRPY